MDNDRVVMRMKQDDTITAHRTSLKTAAVTIITLTVMKGLGILWANSGSSTYVSPALQQEGVSWKAKGAPLP